MKIYRNLTEYSFERPVVTVGTFDGVHLGHYKIIDKLEYIAKDIEGETVVITFWPHPRFVINPNDTNLKLINTLDEKIYLLEKAGIQHLVLLEFTREFSKQSAFEFFNSVLAKQIKAKALVVGYNHHFGNDRQGDLLKLTEYAKPFGIRVEKVDAYNDNGSKVSSTEIRKFIEKGEVETASRYLGYDYFIQGKVVKGSQLGRKLGFPTANIQPELYKIIPANGVYAVKVKIGENLFNGMMNIGFRPTINNSPEHPVIEVYIIDFDQDIYSHGITIFFKNRIRNEQMFENIDSLKLQLHKDKMTVKRLLS